MAKATRLPSGNWRVQVYIGEDENGKKIRKSFTAETKKEAEFLAAQYAARHKESASDMTVGKVIDKYIASKTNVLSPKTISGYKGIRRNNLQNLMDVPLSKLTSEAVQNEINTEAAKLSAKSIGNAYGLLNAALNVYAPDLHLKVTLPAKKKVIRELPDPALIMQIIKGTEIELPCLLAMWLSLRMSEIRGLRKSDIKNGKLIIQNVMITVDGKHIEKSAAKTYESVRALEVPEYIAKLIEKVKTEYLVELSGQAIYKRFIRLQQKNGIDPPIRFHDLRHINASVMVALKVPDKYAMERGGWSTPAVLKSVYQHTFSDERKAVDEAVNNYFNSLLNDE